MSEVPQFTNQRFVGWCSELAAPGAEVQKEVREPMIAFQVLPAQGYYYIYMFIYKLYTTWKAAIQ